MENSELLIGEYTKERLEKLSLHELRTIGRQVGVRLPTTLQIAELIKGIVDVVTGKTPAYVRKTKQGRPPKALLRNKVLNSLLPDSYYGNNMLFEMESYLNSPAANALKSGEFVGLLDVMNEGYGLIRCSGNMVIYISSHMITANNVRNGDELTVLAREIAEFKPWAVAEVKKINGVSSAVFLKENKQRFEHMPAIAATKSLNCEISKDIKFGSKALICVGLPLNSGNFIEKIFKEVKNRIDIIMIDAAEYDINILKQKSNFNVTAIKPEEKFETIVSRCKLALDCAVRRAERGEDAIVVVNSLSKLFRNFNALGFSDGKVILDRVDCTAVFNQKKFFNTAKNTTNGSLTIIGLINKKEQSAMDAFLHETLIELTDVYVEI